MLVGTRCDGLAAPDQLAACTRRRAASDDRIEAMAPAALGNSLGAAGDTVTLSGLAEGDLLHIRASFEVNLRAITYVRSAEGEATRELSFSVSGGVEFLHRSTGAEPEALEVDPEDPLAFLDDFFGPDKTAGRILDFALGGFIHSDAFAQGGDTEKARAAFAELIGEAIRQGIAEARSMFGDLFGGAVTAKTTEEVLRTEELVAEGLDGFVRHGLDPTQRDRAGRMEAFRMQLSVESKSATTIAYDAHGVVRTPDPHEAAFSALG